MRLLKILYYVFFFSFFSLTWFNIVRSDRLLLVLLTAIASIIILQAISYRRYGSVINLGTKTDSVIMIAGMLLLAVIRFAVID